MDLELLKHIDFFAALAARHFERSTIRSRSFKKINKAFSVLRRTKSGSAVSNQVDQEREAVGNSAAGEEGNALFSLCSHLNGAGDPMHVGAGCPWLTCISFCGCTWLKRSRKLNFALFSLKSFSWMAGKRKAEVCGTSCTVVLVTAHVRPLIQYLMHRMWDWASATCYWSCCWFALLGHLVI